MLRFIISRLGESALVLLVMSAVVYSLIGLMPGDPIDLMIGSNPSLTATDVARLRTLYGLDQPLYERYLNWLIAAVQGDFGYSRFYQRPVIEVIGPPLWHTTKLMGLAFLFSTTIALSLGIAAALSHGKWLDRIVNLMAFAGISIPVFWLALLLIVVFAVWLRWLPASGMQTIDGSGGPFDGLRYLILPVITLATAQTGRLARYMRSSMIEVMRMDYIRTARAKGVGQRRVVLRHALRNAMIPVVTVMAISFGSLFSGALVTETMFAQRGMGKTIYDSILGNDFNLALMALLFATLVTSLSNLVADLCYAWLDPRITME